jgi:GntR family transcriptional regulator/MocR family aminotransferase
MRLDPLDGRGPVYRQLYRALRHAILTGRARPGSRLPSTRWLASESGVARNRVVLAYTQLLDEGYATGRVGSGTYVAEALPSDERPAASPRAGTATTRAPRLSKSGRKLAAAGSRWIAISSGLRYDFSCGRPAFRDFPHWVWARLVRRHARPASAADLDYAPAAGLPELRAAIAEHLTRWRGVACSAEQIFVTSGTQQALGLAAGLLLEPGERLGIEEPHYSGARQAFEAARATLVPLRVDGHGLDVGRLAAARGVRMVYVTPAHQFPTGAVMPLARRLALLAWARGANAHVIEDDYDSEYRYGGSPIESLHGLDRAGRVLYAGSFSKILSPALRLGYLVVPRGLVRAFALAKLAADLGTPSFGQRVLADFIREGHLEAHLRRSRRRHAARRTALLEALAEHAGDRIDVRGSAAGLHVMLVVRGARAAAVAGIVRRARQQDVGVYSTLGCYLTRPRRAELLLGHGSLAEDDIRRGVARLAAALPPR